TPCVLTCLWRQQDGLHQSKRFQPYRVGAPRQQASRRRGAWRENRWEARWGDALASRPAFPKANLHEAYACPTTRFARPAALATGYAKTGLYACTANTGTIRFYSP